MAWRSNLTLRDVQGKMGRGAAVGRAKAFDNSCPLSGFIPQRGSGNPQNTTLGLSVNGEQHQQGWTATPSINCTADRLLSASFLPSKPVTLCSTGTPDGVGPVKR
ncbi:fumarylacetoacetate hydrolase family protein [Shigella flexneri]